MSRRWELEDPFADDADPDARPSTHASCHLRLFDPQPLPRRLFVKLLGLLAAMSWIGGCVPTRLGCPTRPGHPGSCRHRFCRNYRP